MKSKKLAAWYPYLVMIYSILILTQDMFVYYHENRISYYWDCLTDNYISAGSKVMYIYNVIYVGMITVGSCQ